jgi:hypothetical protein
MFNVKTMLACALVLAAAAPARAQDHGDEHGSAADAPAPFEFRGVTMQAFADLTMRIESGASSSDRRTRSTFGLGQFSLFLSAPIANNITVVTETALKLGTDNRQSQSIELERVYIKYTIADALKLAFGRTHTALGYWNEAYHHGGLLNPTVARPEILRFGGVMPLHSVGVEVSGRVNAGGGWDVNYVGNFANGRSREFSATQGGSDLDRQKALAFKVSFTHESDIATIIAGPMFYHDTIPADPTRTGRGSSINETIPGFHLVVRSPRVEVISEYFRIRHDGADDHVRREHTGWYAIASGRRTGKWKPYGGIDITEFDTSDLYFTGANTSIRRLLGGARLDLNPHNAIKFEYRRELRSKEKGHVVLFNTAFAF